MVAFAVYVAIAPETVEPSAVSKNLFDSINILLPVTVDRAL